ncbi:MAG: ABC transporter ATP-binding protein, partial [Bdellovibrionales bacterium]|nr:ABC transporter ATP-binding protein [Bdellovibrionales bacterium]
EAVLILFLAAITFKFLFLYWQSKYVHRKLLDIEIGLRSEIFESHFNTQWRHLLKSNDAIVLNALSVESRKMSNLVTSVCKIISSAITSLVYLLIAILVSWQILAITAATVLVLYPLVILLVRRTEGLFSRFVDLNKSVMRLASESLWGLKYLKTVNGFSERLAQFEKENRARANVEHQAYNLKQIFNLAKEPVSMFFAVALIYYGVKFQSLTLASVLVVGYSVQRLFGQLSMAAGFYNEYKEALPSAGLCLELVSDNIKNREEIRGQKFERLTTGLEARGVSFDYGNEQIAIRDVSIRVPKGETTAFIGKSGGGKTTMIDLLSGLLKATKGEILVDGNRIDDWDLVSYREKIGYVPQDPFIVDGTIRENIEMGLKVSETQLFEALKNAHCEEFVERLPEGLNTLVGERGKRLSGGQRQRVALARALLRDPQILILDEPTSALDSESESFVRQSLEALRGKVTIVIVTHRLASVEKADHRYFFQEGQVRLDNATS